MKKVFLVSLLLLGVSGFVNKAEAKGIPVPYSSGEHKLITVVDLPNDSTTYTEEIDGYFNVGYSYKQFWILWVPIWNFDGEYCLLKEGDNDNYFTLTSEELDEIVEKFNLDLPKNPISLWQKLGGKLIIGALIALIIWGQIPSKKKKEEQAEKDKAEA